MGMSRAAGAPTTGADIEAALDQPATTARPRIDVDAGALVGSRCEDCSAPAWPARAVCHRCGSARVRGETFGRDGLLVSCTEVMVSRPGLEAPYMLGQVTLTGGPVLFGRLAGIGPGVELPCPVRTYVERREDGGAGYWFEPA